MNIHDFGSEDPPEWLEDFSLELVIKLDDLVRAYGLDDPVAAIRRAELKGSPVFVTSALSQHRAVMISDRPGQVNMNRAYVNCFDGGGSYVVWQEGVSVEDVRQLVSQLSLLSKVFGPSVEQALGEMEPGINQAACVFKVDEHFKTSRFFSIPFPGIDTVENFIARFDRPEELIAVQTLIGYGVCRKVDEAYILERERVVAMVLDTYGVTLEMVPLLAPGELAKVYRVVDMELDQVFDQK